MQRHIAPIEERFRERYVIDASGCWLWVGVVKANGYGSFSVSHGRTVNAHRFSYELRHGPVPDALVVDHLCGTPSCVNPDHLEAVTQSVNLLRRQPRERARPKQCAHGHAYTPANTTISRRGWIVCKACARARNTRRRSSMTANGLTSRGTVRRDRKQVRLPERCSRCHRFVSDEELAHRSQMGPTTLSNLLVLCHEHHVEAHGEHVGAPVPRHIAS